MTTTEQSKEIEVVHQTATELAVVEIEGEMVREMTGVLPRLVFQMPVGYKRNTHLKFELEVRVRDWAMKENTKGELSREHNFALVEITLIGAYTADQVDPGVGGSAAVSAPGMRNDSDTRPDGESNGTGTGEPDGVDF